MSYIPTTWKSGDVVTSEKLNKLENGVAGGGVLIVNVDDNSTFDKTWQEIYDSDFAIILSGGEYSEGGYYKGYNFVCNKYFDDGEYGIEAFIPFNSTVETYVTDSANGYPRYQASVPIDGDGR